MFKNIFSLGLAIISLVLKGCGLPEGMKSGYHIENGKVVIYTGFPAHKTVIEQADADSFKAINNNYGKDKNYVFLRESIISNADPSTFVWLGGVFAKDKHHGYASVEAVSDDAANFDIVSNPNETPKNVTAEGITYARDSRHVYKYTNILEGADPATFVFVPMFNGHSLTHDENKVYYQDIPLENADGQTFNKLSELYFKDKNAVWTLSFGSDTKWIPIPEADVATFEVLKEVYARDKNHVYYEYKIVEGADLATFQETANQGGKDKSKTYKWGKVQDN